MHLSDLKLSGSRHHWGTNAMPQSCVTVHQYNEKVALMMWHIMWGPVRAVFRLRSLVAWAISKEHPLQTLNHVHLPLHHDSHSWGTHHAHCTIWMIFLMHRCIKKDADLTGSI